MTMLAQRLLIVLSLLFALLTGNVTAQVRPFRTVDVVASLVTTSVQPGDVIWLAGYSAAGDGGEGWLKFDDASGATVDGGLVFDGPGTGTERFVRQWDGVNVRPEWFGAVGNGTADDTLEIFLAISAINDLDGGNLVFSANKIYGVSSLVPGDIVSAESWTTQISGLTNFTLTFIDASGIEIVGNGATIKCLDASVPLGSYTFNWGIFPISGCTDVFIHDLVLDGNRANQTNTSGLDDGHNHGIVLFGDSSDVTIERCTFLNQGTLRNGTDKRGDAVYVVNGCSRIRVLKNRIDNVGRWGVALESGANPTDGLWIEGNVFRSLPRNDGAIHWGFVDLEDDVSFSNIYIRNNDCTGSAGISCQVGGNPINTVKNLVIEGNVHNCLDLDSNDAISQWCTLGTGSNRTYDGLTIRGNRVYYGDGTTDTSTHRLVDMFGANFKDVTIADNVFVQPGAYAGNDNPGVVFHSNAIINGQILFADNIMLTNHGRGLGISDLADVAMTATVTMTGNIVEGANRDFIFLVTDNTPAITGIINGNISRSTTGTGSTFSLVGTGSTLYFGNNDIAEINQAFGSVVPSGFVQDSSNPNRPEADGATYFKLTGTTPHNLDGFQQGFDGQIVVIELDANATIRHQASPASGEPFNLQDGRNFSGAGNILTVRYDGDDDEWFEIHRTQTLVLIDSDEGDSADVSNGIEYVRLSGDGTPTTYPFEGLDGGVDGQVVVIRMDGYAEIVDDTAPSTGEKFSLVHGAYHAGASETITVVYDSSDSIWHELARSVKSDVQTTDPASETIALDSRNVRVLWITGDTQTVDTITPATGQLDGDVLYVMVTSAITLADQVTGSDNLYMEQDTTRAATPDFTPGSGGGVVTFLFDTAYTPDSWREVSRAQN
jgi:hypothetical protein